MDGIGGMKLIDNVNQTLRDDLSNEIKSGSKVSIAAASFSIYAYQELKKELECFYMQRQVKSSSRLISFRWEETR